MGGKLFVVFVFVLKMCCRAALMSVSLHVLSYMMMVNCSNVLILSLSRGTKWFSDMEAYQSSTKGHNEGEYYMGQVQ